jgi:Carboxypeptidase regulatory-like domain
MRHRVRAVAAVAALCAAPVVVGAQAVFGGVVRQARDSASIDRVEVRLDPSGQRELTDSSGRFRLTGLGAGTYTLHLRRIGFRPLTTTITLRARDTLSAAVFLDEAPTMLDSAVTRAMGIPPYMQDFERRRARNMGRFIGEAELDRQRDAKLPDLLGNRLPNMIVMTVNENGVPRRVLVSGRGPASGSLREIKPCIVRLYWDGIEMQSYDLNEFDVKDLAGVEYHDMSTTPVEYRMRGQDVTCGTLLLWPKYK